MGWNAKQQMRWTTSSSGKMASKVLLSESGRSSAPPEVSALGEMSQTRLHTLQGYTPAEGRPGTIGISSQTLKGNGNRECSRRGTDLAGQIASQCRACLVTSFFHRQSVHFLLQLFQQNTVLAEILIELNNSNNVLLALYFHIEVAV